MLAEKNTEAAKALATPTLQKLQEPVDEPIPESISTVPASIIENAKALDTEIIKKNSSGFEDLPEGFSTPDINDHDLAKIMEAEDFGVHQGKHSGGDILVKKKLDPSEIPTKLVKTLKTSRKKKIEAEESHSSASPSKITKCPKLESSPVPMGPSVQKVSNVGGEVAKEVLASAARFGPAIPPQFYPPIHDPSVYPMYRNNTALHEQLAQAGPMHSFKPGGIAPNKGPPNLHLMHNSPNLMPRISSVPPASLMSMQQPPFEVKRPSESQKLSEPSTLDAALKKRGRRKKITPLRDDLPKNDPAQSIMQMKPEFASSVPNEQPRAAGKFKI